MIIGVLGVPVLWPKEVWGLSFFHPNAKESLPPGASVRKWQLAYSGPVMTEMSCAFPPSQDQST